jgi:CHASE2 domain-containing sensor protein
MQWQALAHWVHRFFRHFGHHMVESVPAALFVAALITVVNYFSGVLHPFDTYVFFALANKSAVESLIPSLPVLAQAQVGHQTRIAVLTIDESRYADEYGQLAPLSRCPLLRDMERIYAARPRAVVIDLDISPALWLRKAAPPAGSGQCKTASYAEQVSARCQAECEEQVYRLLEGSGTPTVLMLPFGISDLRAGFADTRLAPWFERMSFAGVKFGDATLAATFGVVLDASTEIDSIAGQTCLALGRDAADCAKPRKGDEHQIDPRKYLDGSVDAFSLADLPTADMLRTGVVGAVVFFGGAWDEDDIHFTPAGAVYGIDVHAASLATILAHAQPNDLRTLLLDLASESRELLEFMLDVALGIVFGAIATSLWIKYFDFRFSPEAWRRECATPFVALLVVFYGGVLLVITHLALIALSRWAIWLSPVPMAFGMFVDSFTVHPVTQSVHSAFEFAERTANLGAVRRLHRQGPVAVQAWRKAGVAGRDQVHRKMQRVKNRHGSGRLALPVLRSEAPKHRFTAMVKACRRWVWLGIVVWGVMIVIPYGRL